MSKHTPGPWYVSGIRVSQPPRIGRDTRIINIGSDDDGTYLAMVFFDMETGRGQADARLIAAAPELLAVLMQIQRMGYTDWGDKVMVDEVIAKATGESP